MRCAKSIVKALTFTLSIGLLSLVTLQRVCAAQDVLPARTFTIGSTKVDEFGDKGTPLILLPGLASGRWVWEREIRALQSTHRIYALTLAGFDGQPPVEGNCVELALTDLDKLLRDEKLRSPVLIGHSLGGTIALRFATIHPSAVSGVVSIDGLPVFPGTEAMNSHDRTQMIAAQRAAPVNIKDFHDQQVGYMDKIGTVSEARAAQLAALTARSDPITVARCAADDLALDFRSELRQITAPVTEIVPYFAPDVAAYGITEQRKREYYRSLLPDIGSLKVVSVSPARHFAMFDVPDEVMVAIRGAL